MQAVQSVAAVPMTYTSSKRRPVSLNFSGTMTALVLFGALIVLAGWIFDVEALKSIAPGRIVMIPNTSVGFIFAATALAMAQRRAQPGSGVVPTLLAVFVFTLGLIMFIERTTGASFGVDLLLFPDAVRRYPYTPPGQIASNSAMCFMLAGSSIILLVRDNEKLTTLREVLVTLGLAIATFALIGYVYGAKPLYSFDRGAGMAIPTALLFTLLFLGLLFARPAQGGVAYITGKDVAADVVRKLLAATLTVPIITGALWIRGRELSFYSRETGIALLTIVTMAVLVGVILQSARVLRRTDQAREALLHEALSASQVKSNFLATMSHELRTPLNAIIGYTNLMSEGIGGQLSTTHADHADRVKLSARHLLSLIDQVLTLSRLEATTERASLHPVAVASLVREAVAITEPLVRAKHLEFVVDMQFTPTIVTDDDKVRQILLNLLSNAVKFTERGEIRLRVVRSGDNVAFDVIDTGLGISLENHARVFEAFWQVDMSNAREHSGAGLGLSVSQQLAQLLGGRVTLQSSIGHGSSFRLELPLQKEA
jgi:signal transduction histidine kinase